MSVMLPRASAVALALSLAGLLAGCGDLPQPFAENPGAEALRLATPPPARLDIPPPAHALLADAQAQQWSQALADSLLLKEVPAVAQPARKGDWHLVVDASLEGDQVVPRYRIVSPAGKVRASANGTPVPADAWASADPALLKANAQLAAAQVSTMLTGIQAAVAQADPNSLLNRPTRIWFTGVTGAPGNGNLELARQMAVLLPDGHNTLQTTARNADYTVSGHVTISKPDRASDGVQHIEIVWTVQNAKGHEAGKATQLHDVPAHSLDGYWGDVAADAAQEAASGIHEVIANNEGRPHPPASGS
ncbi:hypothetical protein [Lichenicola sp.]|uniref:hypothetical protein n=1 Tax=Lichenicola sp. TaxID=2804529 RepID=UPI003B00920B